MFMLWFNFILGLNFIFFCFELIIIHYNTQKQKKIKFKPRRKLNHNIKIIHVQSNLSLRTPLYYGQLVCFQKCQKSDIPYPFYTDTSLYYGQVRLVPEMPKSYIPCLYNTDTSLKRIIGSVPLVSILKRFDCMKLLKR